MQHLVCIAELECLPLHTATHHTTQYNFKCCICARLHLNSTTTRCKTSHAADELAMHQETACYVQPRNCCVPVHCTFIQQTTSIQQIISTTPACVTAVAWQHQTRYLARKCTILGVCDKPGTHCPRGEHVVKLRHICSTRMPHHYPLQLETHASDRNTHAGVY